LRAVREVEGGVVHDAIEMLSERGLERLRKYGRGGWSRRPEGELLPPERP
jgi:hypothetical protein